MSTESKNSPQKTINKENLSIFISHKHDDAIIAESIVDSLALWGFPRNNIFCSSIPGHGPSPGNDIIDDIREFLLTCNVLFFLYSLPQYNWNYCFYEIGTANDDRVETKIVTISLAGYKPPTPLDSKLTINLSGDEDTTTKNILTLAKSFFLEEEFFPGYKAFNSNIDERSIERYARLFQEEVSSHAEKYWQDIKREVKPRWGWFTLKLDADNEDTFRKTDDLNTLDHQIPDMLYLESHASWGLKHFGYDNPEQAVKERRTLSEINSHWQASIEKGDCTDHWVNEIVDEVKRIHTNNGTRLSWNPIKSCFVPDFVYPIITSYENLEDGGVQYKVHMFTLPIDRVKSLTIS